MARSFDGTDDNIEYPNAGYSWQNSAQTHAFWMSADTATNTTTRTFLSFENAGGSTQMFFRDVNADGNMTFLVVTSGTNMSRQASNGTISTGWQHYLVTWTGSLTATNVKIYKNGSEVSYLSTTNGSGTPNVVDGDTNLMGLSGQFMDGDMAEFASWNRVLASWEITALANRWSPLFFPRGRLHYRPLIGDNTNDYDLGPASAVNGATKAAHPRIIFPGRTFSVVPAIASAYPHSSVGMFVG